MEYGFPKTRKPYLSSEWRWWNATNTTIIILFFENNSPIRESIFVSFNGDVLNKTMTLHNIYNPLKDKTNDRNINQFIWEPDVILFCEGDVDNKNSPRFPYQSYENLWM